MSLVIAIYGAGALARIANSGLRGAFVRRFLLVGHFRGAGPFQILRDLPSLRPRAQAEGISGRALIAWAVPIGLGDIFLALFSAANPIVEGWLASIDLRSLLALLDIWRRASWLAWLAVVWPFLVYRPRKGVDIVDGSAQAESFAPMRGAPDTFLEILFDFTPISRSLVLFNLMFAVQTTLDAAILWRGHSLPAGISVASYAHRGAYPLMATALLAGAFVALAMRPGSAASRSMFIRMLVYVWICRNVALAISSLYRLELYIQVYSLTYWRVAAFTWMGLVAVGLVLILVQPAMGRSNRWLLSASAFVLAVALYLCAFVNFDYRIADDNLQNFGRVFGESGSLDVDYIQSIGPDAIPALDEALAMPASLFVSGRLGSVRSAMLAAQQSRLKDWRAWTFRVWRLSLYLEGQTMTKP